MKFSIRKNQYSKLPCGSTYIRLQIKIQLLKLFINLYIPSENYLEIES